MSSVNSPTLRQRVLQAGSWTLAGYGVTQALRLGGNLILTRLLFPEAFGLMAIVQIIIYGVNMLTDVGIGPSIVQKARGNDPAFLNTTWTIQIVRGFLMWGGLCVLALPIAGLYGEPLLAYMLPVVGLTAVIGGFNSTKLFTAQRNLEAARVTQIEIGTYVLGLLCTVYLAWLQQSVWALVWGSLIGACLNMFASHLLLHGIRNQFAWDRDAVDHLVGFGRWILLSSALTFLSTEGSRLAIGALLDMRQLALFTLASMMNLLLWNAMLKVMGTVFFPAYSEVYRTNPKKLMAALHKARLTFILPSWSVAVLFVFFGGQLMGILYDERYHGSGPILELLAAGSLAGCVWGSYTGVLLAIGKVATQTLLTAIHIIFQFAGMFIGYHYGESMGLVIGLAASYWIMYPVNAFVMSRNGLWQPGLDLTFLAASVLMVVLAWPRLTLSLGS
ncbi:oligosaccharide flippase family protein [Sulfuricaulis sp.]|jgi:O-antigen/teichoic acid export membrane protein|uniref:oligosaccharide flippase family protein n=1 Tax=Sulfuricaulis sp. TaxID=2003553 RepID=UPI0035594B39